MGLGDYVAKSIGISWRWWRHSRNFFSLLETHSLTRSGFKRFFVCLMIAVLVPIQHRSLEKLNLLMPSIKPFPSQIGLQYWFMTTGIKFAQQISLDWNRYMYNHAFNITKGVYELQRETKIIQNSVRANSI